MPVPPAARGPHPARSRRRGGYHPADRAAMAARSEAPQRSMSRPRWPGTSVIPDTVCRHPSRLRTGKPESAPSRDPRAIREADARRPRVAGWPKALCPELRPMPCRGIARARSITVRTNPIGPVRGRAGGSSPVRFLDSRDCPSAISRLDCSGHRKEQGITDAVRTIDQGLKDALTRARGDGVATTQEIDIPKRVSGTCAPELARRRPRSRDPSARESPPACA